MFCDLGFLPCVVYIGTGKEGSFFLIFNLIYFWVGRLDIDAA